MPLIYYLMCCVALALLIKSSAGTAQAHLKTYYVNSHTGNDDNPGTQAKPFRSIAKINSLNLNAGEHVEFTAGLFFQVTLQLENIYGAAKDPVVFASYG